MMRIFPADQLPALCIILSGCSSQGREGTGTGVGTGVGTDGPSVSASLVSRSGIATRLAKAGEGAKWCGQRGG